VFHKKVLKLEANQIQTRRKKLFGGALENSSGIPWLDNENDECGIYAPWS
jgi:hypothetical protein